MQTLKVDQFPLSGVRLIEASAGTGKTWTIAGLYLRLLLEHQLRVTDILVVTFTEAATQELRGRIRERLRAALAVLEGRLKDDSLQHSLAGYADRSETRQQLRDALTRMDEAAVYTIHGFCQRMLTDSAFESGSLFDAEFITDVSQLQQQVIEDFWRRDVVAGDRKHAQWVTGQWKHPGELFDAVKTLVERPDIRVQPDINEDSAGDLELVISTFSVQWQSERNTLLQLFTDNRALKDRQEKYKRNLLPELFTSIDTWLAGECSPAEMPDRFYLLTRNEVENSENHLPAKVKAGEKIPDHPLLDACQSIHSLMLSEVSRIRAAFLLRTATFVREEITRRKQDARILFFNDLLSNLDSALQGPGGGDLAQRIRRLHPVAMIDEFQDTDPQQYRIFSTIYGEADEGERAGLFMIGDPKQAIYSFRGADIFTYMQARHDTSAESGHFTLDTNYRSATALVKAVNTLFSHTALPAFLYKDEIDFYPVKAGGPADAEPLLESQQPVAPLKCLFAPSADKPIGKMVGRVDSATGAAIDIARLLNMGVRGEATIGSRPVIASDIAVLVRNSTQAETMRQALAGLGVASVFISRDSVFLTEEAVHFSRVLLAVAEPGNSRAVRTALATSLLGRTALELYTLSHDEQAWDDAGQAFREWQQLWQREGFMPMFRHLLAEQAVASRLLTEPDGERRLTNFLQLAELAQIASLQHPGIEGVIRWLQDARANASDADDQQLRMESDENLVQIVTIHKSKGLQYNIVYLPFIWDSREQSTTEAVLLAHDPVSRELVADLGSENREALLQQAKKERLAEDMRLLYVAFTRARYHNCFVWGRFRGGEDAAMAWLLHPPESYEAGGQVSRLGEKDDASVRADLDALNARETLLDLSEVETAGEPFLQDAAGAGRTSPLHFSADASQQWRMTSFSGLSRTVHERDWQVDLPDHDQMADNNRDSIQPANIQSPFSFPRGAQAGLFMHHVLERLDFPRAESQVASVVTEALELYGLPPHWQKTTERWVMNILQTPLEEGFTLASVTSERRLVELEFHFPLNDLSSTAVNSLLAESRGTGRLPAALDFNTVSGMMKGFVDLVCEHAGRYYVLDYKSNHLGNDTEAYSQQHLAAAIDEHHYDLQYLIYVVALHRYLQQRLPDYCWETHMGGVYYLFLRGMTPDNAGSTGIYRDRPARVLIEKLDARFRGEHHE